MNGGGNRATSPTKRWQTTTGSAMEDVAHQLNGNYDRAGMVKGLNDRKLANTKTSISFGNEKVLEFFFFLDGYLFPFVFRSIIFQTHKKIC